MVTPDLYATSWFITYFAKKCAEVSVVCELWSKVIEHGDSKFMLVFAVALIIHNRAIILNSDKSDLPIVMASLQITDTDELTQLLWQAFLLRSKTPVSFFMGSEIEILFGS